MIDELPELRVLLPELAQPLHISALESLSRHQLYRQTLRHLKVGAPAWRPDLLVRVVSGYRGRRVELAGFTPSRFGTTGAGETSESSAL